MESYGLVDSSSQSDNQHNYSEVGNQHDNQNAYTPTFQANLHQDKSQEANQSDLYDGNQHEHQEANQSGLQDSNQHERQEEPTNVRETHRTLIGKAAKANRLRKPKRLLRRSKQLPNKALLKGKCPTKQAFLTSQQATPQQATTKRKSGGEEPSAKRANLVDPTKALLESRDPATLESRFKGCTIVKDVCVASLVDTGAFGAVFACKTPKGKRIAKVGATPKQVKALVDEFSRYKELSSIKNLAPFLLKTYSLVSFNDLLGNACRAITMDYGGIDLFAMMKQKGMTALNLRDTKSLCRRVLPALKAFHLAGYVHRDVKPQNILILPAEDHGFASMSIRLIDFGLVTKWDPKAKVVAKRSLTCGTARFSSWRQQLGYTAHPHDDLESLIYTMIFLLGGKLPWSSAWSDEPAKHLERDANMSGLKQKANCQVLCLKLDAKRRDTTSTTPSTSTTPTTSTTSTTPTTSTTSFAMLLQAVKDSTNFDVRNYTTFMDLCA